MSVAELDAAMVETEILQRYPAFATTRRLDELRAGEYARLDRTGQVYLDYTGGGQYAESQVRAHADLLLNNVFGNPHSVNPTSHAATELVEHARRSVLDYFRADPGEYVAIFTPNASGALKLVGESYPFGPGGQFVLTYDNHNSVNGIREFAWGRGAEVSYVPVVAPEMRADEAALEQALAGGRPGAHRLFAYPAQSNFSGVQHPLAWIDTARARGWHVLLDAAAFVPTNRLDLSRWQPDFVTISFYKIFGYPTGVGCLLARRAALGALRRPWFAGGTISIASVQGRGWHYLLPDEHGFEDGTVSYLTLPAVEIGLRQIESIGIDTIHARVAGLTGWLLRALGALRHANGRPLATIFGPRDMRQRGGTIAFMLFDPDGQPYDRHQVEMLAGNEGISLRTGCFCNPGAGEVAHGLTRDEMARFFGAAEPVTYDQLSARLRESGKTAATIRISVGLASNAADAACFINFARSFLNAPAEAITAPRRHPRDAA